MNSTLLNSLVCHLNNIKDHAKNRDYDTLVGQLLCIEDICNEALEEIQSNEAFCYKWGRLGFKDQVSKG